MKLYLLILTIFLAGCSQQVEIRVLAPAKVASIASARRIAVMPFKHDRIGLSDKITALLANQTVNSKPYFTLLSRKNLNKILTEQKLQSSQLINANTATKVGKLIGAQALVTGGIGIQSASSKRYYQAKKECLNFSKKNLECTLWHVYKVVCYATQATLSANINIVNIQTGSIIYSDTLSKNYNGDSCKNRNINLYLLSINIGSNKLLSKGQALNLLTSQIAHEFINNLIPHYIHFKVTLLDDIKIDVTSEQKDALKNALLFIKANRLNKAKTILEQLMFKLHGKSYVIAYDLGTVDEALGELNKAKKLYHVADNLTNKPIAALDKAINRINNLIIKRNLAMRQIDAK